MLDQAQVPTLASVHLEEAFNSTVEKLKGLFPYFDTEEQAVFREMLAAAGKHTDEIQAASEGDPEKAIYTKPVQVHATTGMKQRMRELSVEFA